MKQGSVGFFCSIFDFDGKVWGELEDVDGRVEHGGDGRDWIGWIGLVKCRRPNKAAKASRERGSNRAKQMLVVVVVVVVVGGAMRNAWNSFAVCNGAMRCVVVYYLLLTRHFGAPRGPGERPAARQSCRGSPGEV